MANLYESVSHAINDKGDFRLRIACGVKRKSIFVFEQMRWKWDVHLANGANCLMLWTLLLFNWIPNRALGMLLLAFVFVLESFIKMIALEIPTVWRAKWLALMKVWLCQFLWSYQSWLQLLQSILLPAQPINPSHWCETLFSIRNSLCRSGTSGINNR